MLPDVTIAILIVLQLVLLVLLIIIIILINVPNVHLVQLVLPVHPDPLARHLSLAHLIIAQLAPLAHLHTLVPLVLLLLHTHQ